MLQTRLQSLLWLHPNLKILVIGRPGSGKTTIIRCIGKFLQSIADVKIVHRTTPMPIVQDEPGAVTMIETNTPSNKVVEFDVLLFVKQQHPCIDKIDVEMIDSLIENYGRDVWKKMVFVITFIRSGLPLSFKTEDDLLASIGKEIHDVTSFDPIVVGVESSIKQKRTVDDLMGYDRLFEAIYDASNSNQARVTSEIKQTEQRSMCIVA